MCERANVAQPVEPEAGDIGAAPVAAEREEWWRWGRIELPVQNTFPENFLQAFPANLGVSPLPDPRPAGCRTGYPVMPLGSLTPLTGVGDAAPPLMTPSRPGEVGPRRCSLTKQRERTDGCQLRFARGLTRPASNLGLRFPVHGPCRNLTSPRTDSDDQCTRPMRECEHPF
jgi:hypothetical protein